MNLEESVPGRYVINYSKEGGIFRILDSWHSTIKNLKLEENPNIPDDSPAIKIISTEEVNALVGELIKLGWLDKMVSSRTNTELLQPIQRSKTLTEIAVENIQKIVYSTEKINGADKDVAREAVVSIREIIGKREII